jgi:secreted trypsin-like serine protease
VAGQLLRTAAFAAALLGIVAASSALGSRQVVGGVPADVRSAPWTVLVAHGSLTGAAFCTGAILDPLHVLTAGHCVFDPSGGVASAHTFLVRAGVTDAITPSSTDVKQDRTVTAIRVHPGYRDDPRDESDDVAVLTLSAPLDLTGPTAQAIALPSPGLRLRSGQAVGLTGFGDTSANAGPDSDVTLNRMSSTLIPDVSCLRPPNDAANAVIVCAFSGTNSPCHGDSGAPLVLTTPTPVAVGVTGAGTCDANTAAEFADLTSPEILAFVEGNDDPPLAPRETAAPALSGPTPTPQVGQTLTCAPGSWTGTPTLGYAFLETTAGLVLRSGPSSYRLGLGDSGRNVLCRVARE